MGFFSSLSENDVEKLVRLKAELSALQDIMNRAREIDYSKIERIVRLKGQIAVLEYRVGQTD